MITEALIRAAVAVILGMASVLPRHTFDVTAMADTFGQVASYAGGLNGYAPVLQLGLAVGLLASLKLALMAWNVVLFIYHQFWGSS